MKPIKEQLKDLIARAAAAAHDNGALPAGEFPQIDIEVPKLDVHGDFSTNLAMVMAKIQKMAPRKIAEAIIAHLDGAGSLVAKAEIAGPGFINFFIRPSAWLPILTAIHESGDRYGASDMGRGRKVQVEFVSANPTGPLHVGHGRGAAVGDTVASLLAFIGYDVAREYYINDSGRQIRTLGRSVYLRCLELTGAAVDFPGDCYQGDYIIDIAKKLIEVRGTGFLEDEPAAVEICARHAATVILSGIRQDLDAFGVRFENWFSEQSLFDSGRVEATLADLKKKELAFEKDGALWFATTRYGDEKDRVVVRSNGQTTYFASDIAYHQDKYRRGFEWVIDVWGADHHGYIPRMAAAVEATGQRWDQFQVILIQLVNLLRDGAPVAMSSRAGEFVTLKEVVDEVGRDAARFIFLTRHYDSKLDFDLELAKRKSNDNPVYYVQYVHARISSIFAKQAERTAEDPISTAPDTSLLKEPEEIGLMKLMGAYPEVVAAAAMNLEPHRIPYFLMELAAAFHAYYNRHRVLCEDQSLAGARLHLIRAVQKVIRNGLTLLGVSSPEKM